MKIIGQGAFILTVAAVLAAGGAEARPLPQGGVQPTPQAALGNRRPDYMSHGGSASNDYLSSPGTIRWNTLNANGTRGSSSTGGSGGGDR